LWLTADGWLLCWLTACCCWWWLLTGRSIGMVEGLLAKKAGVMPWPAAIITAVGTKVG